MALFSVQAHLKQSEAGEGRTPKGLVKSVSVLNASCAVVEKFSLLFPEV